MCPDSKVTSEIDGQDCRGHLTQDQCGEWTFQQRDDTGSPVTSVRQTDLGSTWRELETEGVLLVGWHDHLGFGRHASAKDLRLPCPGFLWKAMGNTNSPDHGTWLEACREECKALRSLDTCKVIDKATVTRLGVTPTPTMNMLTAKPDAQGNPLRAKSRTVVLGNEEERVWEKTDVFAPVISETGARAFVANGVAIGRVAKQADTKNAFCHPTLPDDEICAVLPPKGCPFSKAGDHWPLKKTFHGLRRSPRH